MTYATIDCTSHLPRITIKSKSLAKNVILVFAVNIHSCLGFLLVSIETVWSSVSGTTPIEVITDFNLMRFICAELYVSPSALLIRTRH